MTAIASRSVLVTSIDEGPTSDLEAALPYPDPAYAVQLTREVLEDAGGIACRLGRAFAARLDLLHLSITGLTDGVPLGRHSVAVVTFTGTALTPIPAGTTIKAAADATLWSVDEDTEIPLGETTVDAAVTCVEAGPEAALAHALDTISPAVVGLSAVDNALAATPGAIYALTLQLRDRRTGSVVQPRSSLVETVAASGIYQLEADPDQRSRLADVPGLAGRLVIRWAAADDHPPPEGLWSWELTAAHPDGAGLVAAGTLEVLR